MADISAQKMELYRKLAEKADFNDQSLNEFIAKRVEEADVHPSQIAPYAGISTFLGLPHKNTLNGADIAVVGVPYDLAVTNRPGARYGPRAVRDMSILSAGPRNHATGVIPSALANIIDFGDVRISSTYDIEKANAEIEAAFHQIIDSGVVPLSVGGDHSISYPILKAVGKNEPVGMIHIDAHADTGGPFNGSRFHHGGPFRNAVLDGVLDPERTIQIGIRGRAEHLWDFSFDSGMRVVRIEEFYELGLESVLKLAREVVGEGPTYISFDIDSIDPAFAPGTGTPEVGGLMPLDVQQFLRGLGGLNIIGADVVEVSPSYDATGNTAHVASTMLWELLCILAQSFNARSS